jgi:hypothetical protein
MTVLAGMDLGFGSQVQLVRTNYLYVAAEAAKGGTYAQQATYLQLFNDCLNKNQTGGGLHPLTCDYLICEIAGTGTTQPNVATLLSSATLPLPLMGPVKGHLGQGGNTDASGSTAADQGTSANGQIISILSTSILDITMSETSSVMTIDSAAVLDTLIGTGGSAGHLNSLLYKESVDVPVSGGVSSGSANMGFFIMGDLHTDLTAAAATGAVEINGLTTSPVFAGNASGTTGTDLGTVVDAEAADCNFILTVIGLVKAY